MDEQIEIMDFLKIVQKLLLWMFIFCAAGSFWHWSGMEWWAGLLGMSWVILAFVIEVLEYDDDDRFNGRQRNRRSW